jgi:hypothetical protein
MEGTGLSGALVRLQARFVDWLIGRELAQALSGGLPALSQRRRL